MQANNQTFERPFKNYRRFDIYKAGIAIIAAIARIRNEATIVWESVVKPLSVDQAKEYIGAIRLANLWASQNGGGKHGWVYIPGKVLATDDLTFTKRLLFHDDDHSYVEIRRTKLAFGLFTKPQVTHLDGGVGDMQHANQVADSMAAALKDAQGWK
jgi:hypothetical protein